MFLVGAERSGTTLLRLMLDHHPRICFNAEFEFVVDRVSEDGDYPPLPDYLEWLETESMFLAAGLRVDRTASYPVLVHSFLAQRLVDTGKSIVGATVHRHFERLTHLWPDARFLHLVRNPRDVAPSCVEMGWAGNVWTGVERWIEAERCADRLRPRIPADRWLEERYESLVSDPVASLSRICAFLGVEYDDRMLAYPASTTYGPVDPSLANRWRERLSDRDVRLVEARVGPLLASRGYEASGLEPRHVNSAAEWCLRAQDWVARVRFRVRRFGLLLVASEFLLRRLGLRSLQKPLRLRIQEINASYRR